MTLFLVSLFSVDFEPSVAASLRFVIRQGLCCKGGTSPQQTKAALTFCEELDSVEHGELVATRAAQEREGGRKGE
jgi:hypothetical protein